MNPLNTNKIFSAGTKNLATGVLLASGMCVQPLMAEVIPVESTAKVQQQAKITVKGVVKEMSGEPVVGANVFVVGTTSGTMTDFDGKFSIDVSPGATIQITYIGYLTKDIVVKNASDLNIVLVEDSQLVDEVVVIGYGTQRKGDITSAISSVKAEDFSVGKIGDAAELIKGKIAGLSIIKSSGDPNETSDIMLRGITTVSGNVSPLVLVDGIEGSLTTVAPENIESIDVLKDASAAAIYGTRGANGVIIITTKTGKRDSKPIITYNGYGSVSNWYKTADFMNTNDVIYAQTSYPYEGYDTDWLAAVTRKSGYTQNHSFSITGGTENSTYSANITYADEEGIMRKSDRNNIKAQLDFSQYFLNDILKINVNLLHSRYKHTNNSNTYVYRQALIHNPSSPIYNSDGSYYEELSRFQYYNPVSIQNEQIGDTRSNFTSLTGNITLEPIKGWQTNLMLSTKENISTGQTYYTSNYYSQMIASCKGWASKGMGIGRSNNLELTSKYEKTINTHRLSALVGYSYLYNLYDGFNAGNGNFSSESYLYNNLAQGSYLKDEGKTASLGSYKNDNTLIGYFGRVSYGYDNKYNALVSVRREGSSKFGDNNKWGTFKSLSLGWTLSNEEFLSDFYVINNLKLRAGYGETGVIPNESYLSLNVYDYDTYGYQLNESGEWIPSLKVTQNPNPNLKWETTKEYNIGLDWAVLDQRLSGSIDIYSKKTSDLLYDYAVPVPPNMYGYTKANVGKMSNKGIEIMVDAIPIKTSDFEWSTTVTMSHNKNKLISLSNDLYETENFKELWGGLSDPISVPTHCMEVGKSLGDFWGLKSVGVSKDGVTLVEVSDGNGGWIVKEFDTKYNEQANRQRLGSGLPKVYAGWANTFSYKNFDLSLQFTGQFGFMILNEQRCFYENNSIAYNKLKSAAKWYGAQDTDLNPVIDLETGKQMQVRLSSSMSQGFWSDHLEKGDFVKLTNATFGYTFNLKGNATKYCNSLRVYVSGQNLFCITGYSGLDPEVSNYFQTPGVDSRDKYPTTRSFSLGLNVNF